MTMARRMVFQRRRRSERTTHTHTHAHTSSLDLIPSESVRVVPCVLVDVADRAIVACRVVSCYFYFLSYCYRCLYTHTHTHFINTERKKKVHIGEPKYTHPESNWGPSRRYSEIIVKGEIFLNLLTRCHNQLDHGYH